MRLAEIGVYCYNILKPSKVLYAAAPLYPGGLCKKRKTSFEKKTFEGNDKKLGSASGIRTRVSTLRGWRARPLH